MEQVELDPNAKKKKTFLEYFKDVPIQSLGANYIGVDEDTITNWKKADSEFSDCIDNLKAEYARRNLNDVKSTEWKLERVMNDHFGQRTKTDLTSGGEKITPIFGGNSLNEFSTNNSNTSDIQPTQED